MSWQQRFARLVTNAVVRVPGAWRFFRGPLTRNFDRLAPTWDASRVSDDRLRPVRAALEAIPAPPARVLDLGTGSGAAARLAALLWPHADILGVDVSRGMIDEARRLTSSERERYEVADSAALPYADGSFELVTLNNMIPFFDEVARVTAPGGHVAVAFALGPSTPIYVPLDRVRTELERRGFVHVADFSPDPGQSLLARKAQAS